MREEVLRLGRVTCLEQGVVQLENFNLQIFRGEIMGLLAVNSHGLNTLLHLLRRKLPLERGYIYYRERQINAWNNQMSDHTLQRIGIIENRSALVSGMTVADNIFVLRQFQELDHPSGAAAHPAGTRAEQARGGFFPRRLCGVSVPFSAVCGGDP